MEEDKRKFAAKAVAVAIAASLLIGGTFAWQGISQTALNEASDVINPGGRLHDDFNGENKDVYVENFASEEIFARIRVEEYFEIVVNDDIEGAEVMQVITEGADKDDEDTWVPHNFAGENATDKYWNWEVGGKTVFMPTFNKNKDSLVADINGTYAGADGIDDEPNDDRYTDYTAYFAGALAEGVEIYDIDSNDADEVLDNFENAAEYTDNVQTVDAVHEARETLETLDVISMQKWIDAGKTIGPYWVYDEDGWVYWAQPIEEGQATGLLLDSISLKEVMDDSWYYGINVIGQFITANDLGSAEEETGFFDTEKGPAPTENALTLLETIGVDCDQEYAADQI